MPVAATIDPLRLQQIADEYRSAFLKFSTPRQAAEWVGDQYGLSPEIVLQVAGQYPIQPENQR